MVSSLPFVQYTAVPRCAKARSGYPVREHRVIRNHGWAPSPHSEQAMNRRIAALLAVSLVTGCGTYASSRDTLHSGGFTVLGSVGLILVAAPMLSNDEAGETAGMALTTLAIPALITGLAMVGIGGVGMATQRTDQETLPAVQARSARR